MIVSECVFEEKKYICLNELKLLKIKKFPGKNVNMTKTLEYMGYNGNIVRALYVDKSNNTFYIPDRKLEDNNRSKLLLEKNIVMDILKKKYNLNMKSINFVDKQIIDELEKNNKKMIIEVIPSRIKLDEEELLTIDNIYATIKLYGKRIYDQMYFSSKDFSDAFEIPNLLKILKDKNSSYKYGIHYKIFYTNEEKDKICHLLTFEGTLKILFTKKTSVTTPYLKWICETIFSVQYGTNDDKDKIISEMLKITPAHLKHIFGPLANTLPAVYLVKLGTKDELNGIFELNKYNTKSCVYKFGYSVDLKTRLKQHKKFYEKLGITKLELAITGFIDPIYLSNAETDMNNLFAANNIKLEHEKYEELVVIDNSKIIHYINMIKKIAEAYTGHTKELQERIEEYQNALKLW